MIVDSISRVCGFDCRKTSYQKRCGSKHLSFVQWRCPSFHSSLLLFKDLWWCFFNVHITLVDIRQSRQAVWHFPIVLKRDLFSKVASKTSFFINYMKVIHQVLVSAAFEEIYENRSKSPFSHPILQSPSEEREVIKIDWPFQWSITIKYFLSGCSRKGWKLTG